MRYSPFIKITQKNFTTKWKPNLPSHKMALIKTSYNLPHPIWDLKSIEEVQITHKPPITIRDNFAYYLMKILRISFDKITGFSEDKMNESLYLRRCIFLETLAAVPGFVGGMIRHLNSLRSLRIDGGWIHHLLEEAENERMHLFTFLRIREPGFVLRCNIVLAQFFFVTGYSLLYILSPTTAHRFVGYLEEEAIKTYTQLLRDIDEGKLEIWGDLPAPQEAIKYWGLPYNARMREVILCIRADECSHREFNHRFADIPKDSIMSNYKLEILEEIREMKEIRGMTNEGI